MPRPFPHRTALAAAAVAAALIPAASAAADSIVYVDGGNVFSATPDGSRKVQLTDGGDWHSPTQADDGTIAAVKGAGPIQLLARDGRPLRTITTEQARSGDGGTFAPRPVELSLSPDGSRLAYSYVANSCPPASTCGTVQTSTFYTYTNGPAASPQSLFGQQFSVSNPEWIGNDRVLLTGGYGSALDVDDLAGGGDSSFTRWWRYTVKDVADAEVSRDGRKLAYLFDYGANTRLAVDVVNGDAAHDNPPPDTTPSCYLGGLDAAWGDPSWSPDSAGLAVHDADGLEVVRLSGVGANHCELAGASTLLAPGGGEPDWGPADPPAARYSAVPAPAPGPAAPGTQSNAPKPQKQAGGQDGGAKATSHDTVAVVGARTLSRAALRRGRASVKVAVGRAGGRVTVKLLAGHATVATATGTATASGTVTLRLRHLVPRAGKLLAGRRSVTLEVTVRRAGEITARARATRRLS